MIDVAALPYLLASVPCVLLLIYLHTSHRRRVKAGRAAAFDDCLTRFGSYRLLQDDVDYPVLQGRYRELEVELALVADHVGYRKVPSLWLMATLKEPIACEAVLDYLVRPQNIEFYSPSTDLEHDLQLPAHWPPYARLRSDSPENLPPLSLFDPTVALFADESMKELLVTPKGARLVCQVDQARRRDYLVLRAVGFDNDRLDAERVCSLLDELVGLRDRVDAWAATADRGASEDASAPEPRAEGPRDRSAPGPTVERGAGLPAGRAPAPPHAA